VVTVLVGIHDLIAEVKDPELPFLSIIDLGIVRSVEVQGRRVTVTITPTYSGCPAMDAIRTELEDVLESWGFVPAIHIVRSPAWTTDDITADGRRLLTESGIAPPGPIADVHCPRCSGAATTINEFGSTACKALMVCSACGEPFDLFKELR
jgi:ring-1,2-phenylacetyl-CoA epoxidase subunit PaaD